MSVSHPAAAELFHRTVGRGPPLLALHGPGFDHTYLRPALDPLTDTLAVTYLDLRGNGRSRRPASADAWQALTLERLVEDVEEVRSELAAERILLLGHCFGGAVAQEYVLRHPERVQGLILVSAYPAFDYLDVAFGRAVARATPAQLEALQTGFGAPIADDATFERLWHAVQGVYFHHPDDAQLGRAFAGQRASAAGFNWSMQQVLPSFSTVDRLPTLRVPTLIVVGDDDWLAPYECTTGRLASGLPDARVAIVERSGHFPFLEQPVEWERQLRAWLSECLGIGTPGEPHSGEPAGASAM